MTRLNKLTNSCLVDFIYLTLGDEMVTPKNYKFTVFWGTLSYEGIYAR